MSDDLRVACEMLEKADNIAIISHCRPDGDTLGSAFALLYTLEKLEKTARVICADPFPDRYNIIYGQYIPKEFKEEFVVSVDAAGPTLLGELEDDYANRIDLCIDHHISNRMKAKHRLLDYSAPATAQLTAEVIAGLGVEVDKRIANAIFTGLATDTGCFKYENVTPKTHRCAAQMIEAGADHGRINKLMFDSISKGRLEVDRQAMESLEYHFSDICAVITIPEELPRRFSVSEEELDGISARPRQIDGVKAGVTLRGRDDGAWRVSVRSGDGVNASSICGALGGGGHANAAGCTIKGSYDEVKRKVLDEVQAELRRVKAI